MPSVPEANADDVIASTAGAIVIDAATDFTCAGLPLSLTVAVKLNAPLAVGIPEITPLPAFSANPAGRLPELIDHV